ncbi:MAG TPA: hypothetical protein VFQ61_22265 [Polyangiaceae bacterium]|nr:hypothetical protein [Polyangiaceae bacterium]
MATHRKASAGLWLGAVAIQICVACGTARNPEPKSVAEVTPKLQEPAATPHGKSGACGDGQWCVASGIPKAVTFSSIWGSSSNDIWLAGEAGTLVHWDGVQWTQVESGTQNSLRALTGTSATDVWAAGLEGTLLHYDGSTWSGVQRNGEPWSPTSGPNTRPIYALYAAQPQRLWAAGSGARYFDGTAWSEPHHGSHLPIMGLWSSGEADTWAVGFQGTITRWDGHHWERVGRDMGPNYLAVWGSARNDVWIVGSAGAALHWDGTGWSAIPSGTTNDLHAVRGFNAKDVWAVGDRGTILHWEGSAWVASPSLSERGLLALWGASAADVWAVGENGIVLRRQN